MITREVREGSGVEQVFRTADGGCFGLLRRVVSARCRLGLGPGAAVVGRGRVLCGLSRAGSVRRPGSPRASEGTASPTGPSRPAPGSPRASEGAGTGAGAGTLAGTVGRGSGQASMRWRRRDRFRCIRCARWKSSTGAVTSEAFRRLLRGLSTAGESALRRSAAPWTPSRRRRAPRRGGRG